METVSAKLVVMSHLSDAQELMNNAGNREAQTRINFAKFIILRCNGNLNQEIDADALWAEFIKTPHYKG